MVADLLYFRDAPGGKAVREATTGEIYATDRYTLEMEFSSGYNFQLMYLVGYEDRSPISPPETEESRRWEDQVGTGPFMFEEYVVGSHMTYLRNPIWWQTATIDGVEYKLPFVDKVIIPIMPDIATQIAAIRTAKLDWIEYVAAPYWESLISTAPSLKYRIGAGVSGVT
ncbi:MAG: ABC transporter substrate-binding protein, partial [Nitrosopumilus sp.]